MTTAIELSEYDVQANDFAAKHGVSLTVISHKFGSMDWDKDGQKRNIFKLKLARGERSYVFDFGSSAVDSCEPSTSSKWDQLKESDTFQVYCGLKNSVIGYVSIKFSLTKENASNISDEQIEVWAIEYKNEWELKIITHNAKLPKWKHFEKGYFDAEKYVRAAIERTIKQLQNDKTTVYLNQKKEIVSPSMYTVLSCLTKYDPGSFENFCGDFGYDTDSISALKTYKGVCKEWKAIDSMFSDVIEELQEIN